MDLAVWKEGVISINIWYIALAILVFSSLIFIHEFGHYLCARLCGVGVYEFAIGMGPRLFGWTSKKSGIKYSVRALPIGGYVSMVGEDEESNSEEAFCNRPVWKRMLIVLAGPAMNLLLGFLAMLIVVTSSDALGGTEIVYPPADVEYVSNASGLQDGDVILKVGNVLVFEANSLVYEISHQGDAPIDITVRRGNEKIVVEDVLFPQREQSGVVMGKCDFKVKTVPFSFGNVVKHTFFRSASTVKMVVDSFADLR